MTEEPRSAVTQIFEDGRINREKMFLGGRPILLETFNQTHGESRESALLPIMEKYNKYKQRPVEEAQLTEVT